MAYDTVRESLFLFTDDPFTWIYASQPAAVTVSTGCQVPPNPRLTAFGLPRLGRQGFAIDLTGGLPSAPASAILSSGSATAPWGPQCTLYLDPSSRLVAIPGTTNAGGFMSSPLAILMLRQLEGYQLQVQAAVVNSEGHLGVALSDGLHLTLGY